MLATSACLLLLAAGRPPAAEDALATQAELDACAQRIEELKARHEVGRELDRLLRRAQELAAEMERARTDLPSAPVAPSSDELRERADAARDAADRLTAEIGEIDVRIEDVQRARGEPGGPVARAALGTPTSDADRLHELAVRRAELVERRARAEAAAARLDREARDAEAAELGP